MHVNIGLAIPVSFKLAPLKLKANPHPFYPRKQVSLRAVYSGIAPQNKLHPYIVKYSGTTFLGFQSHKHTYS